MSPPAIRGRAAIDGVARRGPRAAFRSNALGLMLLAAALLGCVQGTAGAAPSAPSPSAAATPDAAAIRRSEQAARAVLARGGRESCLRGKLTHALLQLSRSCEQSGAATPLCRLADQAVVVTPMSLTFMDETSRQLLDLIGAAGSSAPGGAPRTEPQASADAPEP